jgi:hypothetical protein
MFETINRDLLKNINNIKNIKDIALFDFNFDNINDLITIDDKDKVKEIFDKKINSIDSTISRIVKADPEYK